MRLEFRYVLLGLGIGILIAGLLITGMISMNSSDLSVLDTVETQTATRSIPSSTAPALTPQPTRTPTPTPTYRYAITRTPRPTATVDPIQAMIDSGRLSFAGPLSDDEQKALYETSLNYVASNSEQSLLLAKELNNVRYGNPSNTCGPLAIAILQEAGLLDSKINPHDFWLLNPSRDVDRALLDRTFPSAFYQDTRFRTPLNQFDWSAFPLVPGDFLYIYAGNGGNFDHMLVVNRIDQAQRAYAVTNINTAEGFIITEVMLYDPHDPSMGMFRNWTDMPYAILGSTGFGGFEIWRMRKF